MTTELMRKAGSFYIASRASIPQRAKRWRDLRHFGWQITSSWIDEAGEGQTVDFTDLWDRIMGEIAASQKVVLYAEPDDFPLKGALIEAGIALGMGKVVVVCLPGVKLDPRSSRPLGSWIAHRNVTRIDDLRDAMSFVGEAHKMPGAPLTEAEVVDRVSRSIREQMRN